jgi:hypothetical protein
MVKLGEVMTVVVALATVTGAWDSQYSPDWVDSVYWQFGVEGRSALRADAAGMETVSARPPEATTTAKNDAAFLYTDAS